MLDFLCAVLAVHPFLDIKVSRSVQRDWIFVEQIGHEDKVATIGQIRRVRNGECLPIGRKLIGYELDIVESMADDIGETGRLSVSYYARF